MAEACASEIRVCVCVTDSLLKLMPGIHVCRDALHGDCMADVLLQESLPLQMRLFRHAGLRCAVPCHAVLCRAVLCCAVLCCAQLCCALSSLIARKEMTRSNRHQDILLMLTLTFHAGS